MPPADTEASTPGGVGASDTVSDPGPGGRGTPARPGVPAEPPAPADGDGTDHDAPATPPGAGLRPGGPGYRRMSLALFAAGVATFALLYSTQALLPALTDHLNAPADQASWTVSAATGALALAVLPLSALSERFGRRTLMTGSLAVAAGIALVTPFAGNLGWLIALRAVQGAALAGVPASAMAYLAEEVQPKALTGAVGLFVAGNSIGGMSGRVLTGWIAQAWGWRAALVAVGVLAVLCALAFRLSVPPARNFRSRPTGPRELFRTVWGHLRDPSLCRLYGIGALFMTVFGAVYTVIGYRLVGAPFNLPQGIVGSIFLIYLVGTVTSATAGRLVGRLGRPGALYLGVGTTTVGLLLTLAAALVAVLTGLVLITAGFFVGHAVASSSVSRTANTARAQASALYQTAYYLGSSAGGALGAVAFHRVGWAGTVLLGLAAMVAAAVVTGYPALRAAVERRAGAPAAARR